MTREIKFRAWDEDAEEMIYSDKETDGWWEMRPFRYWFVSGVTEGNQFEPPEPKVDYIEGNKIMQFTGLLDRNGKGIYEGDIISNGYGVGVIKWDENHCAFKVKWAATALDDDESWIPFKGMKYNEIIGDIYRNPELLK